MDWLEDVNGRLRKRRAVLFARDNPLIAEVTAALQTQGRRTVVLWALDLAAEMAAELARRLPGEDRPVQALLASAAWARGQAPMAVARRAILACHGLARELDDPAAIALCHAVGQACSVVHTVGHGPGGPMYELTALVRRLGPDGCHGPVEARQRLYLEKLRLWAAAGTPGPWAPFLRDAAP